MTRKYKYLFLTFLLIFFHNVTPQSSQEAPENGFLKREFSLIKPYSGKFTRQFQTSFSVVFV